MKKTSKAILGLCGIGAAGYAFYRSRKSKRASDIWNFYAPVYNTFMRKDRALYEEMYRRIRAAIQGKRTLELCTGTGLIAKHVADSYPAFLERNGWRVREKAVLEASIPLVYAECKEAD